MNFNILLFLLLVGLSTDLAYGQSCYTTAWTTWACSVTCGNGTFTRTRNCMTNTTASCNTCWETNYQQQLTQTMTCIRNPCPYCSWTGWNVSSCSATCDTGFRLRSRQCLTNTGQPCGNCGGEDVESQICTELPACPGSCPVHSHPERNYTDCGVTCQNRVGSGSCQVRDIACICNPGYFRETIGGQCVRECDCGCVDSSLNYHSLNAVWNDTCATYVCNSGGKINQIGIICDVSFIPTPIDGGWTDWSDPTPVVCSATCGNGTRPQYRTCTNPAPQFGGSHCTGFGFRLVDCTTNITCPGTDTWSEWSAFSGCSVTCGTGVRVAYRNCTPSASVASGSVTCSGSSINTTSCSAGPCPTNGSWTDFSSYSTCSSICSPGIQASYRNCLNQTAGGLLCTGSGLQFRTCSGYNESYQCNAIGNWSAWGSWSACSVSCGVGFQYQTRQCLSPGFGCVGEAVNTRSCNTTIACPVDGNWTNWSNWSSCPATCGTATIYRTRNCVGASNGGICLGSSLDTQLCNTNVSCSGFAYNATNGNFTSWSNWGPCSSTCGTGLQIRSRSCTNPLPRYGGNYCAGSPIDIRSCNATQLCPTDGNWSEWSEFSDCSGTCGSGTRSRVRVCSNPPPTNGGQQCPGASVETENCSTDIECPVDGVWNEWELTGECFGICGIGKLIYTRTCTTPIGGGMICAGPTQREEACNLTQPCPVDGGWSQWSSFTVCSVTCGVGTYSRIRQCNNPVPLYGGDLCVGPSLETAYCLTNVSCPINGGWTQWTGWSNCSLNCSGGIQTRTRTCTNPAPANNGAPCIGSSYQYQTCNDDIPCVILITGNPINGTWSLWSTWSACAGTCGNGLRTRYRNCLGQYNGGYPCLGSSIESETCATNVICPIDGGWSNFTAYGPCSATCRNGTRVRTRNCNNPIPQHGGAQCVGDSRDIQACSSNINCPIDGGWSAWAESPCSSTCGIGYRIRQRNCSNPAAQYGGVYCIGSAIDTVLCNVSNVICPIMGTWGQWVNATSCSASCGYGIRIRNRTCLPAGSINCVGSSVFVETCDSGFSCATPAPWNSVNGEWSEWTGWTGCSVSCENGTQYRTRSCNNPTAAQGGSLCRGDSLETRTCDTGTACPVNGNWTEWTSYSACSTTCGPGVRTRIRYCNNTKSFSELCIGHALETTVCNEETACPEAGIWENWTTWSTCSGSCGIGIRVRTRSCTVALGGEQCSGSGIEAQQCNTTVICPIDGGWGNWTNWTSCSSGSCAAGTSYRYRACDNPSPSYGGQLCVGNALETRVCYGTATCPTDGNWSPWSGWSACSSTCAGGRRYRNRTCSDPPPSNGGLSCIGSSVEIDGTCGNATCGANPAIPVGQWTNWDAWSDCATTCGAGIRRRTRSCNTTGLPCVGLNYEIESCVSSIGCPVDGVWENWGSYTSCTASCGIGVQTRTRACRNQTNGGHPCVGSATQTISCDTNVSCPVDGQWTTWSQQSPCSVTCGTGFTVRTRSCTQIVSTFGGFTCPGSSTLTETCTAAQPCPVDGQWGPWKPWSACTATCGKNSTKYTTRVCDTPTPLYGGSGCVGVAFNVTTCPELSDCPACPSNQVLVNTAPTSCPLLCSNPRNTNWCQTTPWTPRCLCRSPFAWNSATNSCSLWCDCGCYGSNNTLYAVGAIWQENTCLTYECTPSNNPADPAPRSILTSNDCSNCSYFGWSSWSSCSVSCGQGSRTRNRSCLYLNSNTPCNECVGGRIETQICERRPCEVCQLGPYEPASECSRTCGNGTQLLNRTCFNIADSSTSIPQLCSNTGLCSATTPANRTCNPDECIICNWSTWINGRCNVSCGTGYYSRNRICIDQYARNCTTCTFNPDTSGIRPCFLPSCTGRRRRGVIDWLSSWFDE